MNRKTTKYNLSDNPRLYDVLTRIVLAFICVVVIAWVLPRITIPRYERQVGQPWMDDLLIAPVDFSVMRNRDLVKAEEDSVKKAYQPYFNYNAKVEEEVLARFHEEFSESQENISAETIPIVDELLHSCYDTGIMSQKEFISNKDSTKAIRVLKGNDASTQTFDNLYSPSKACDLILDDIRLASERPKLMRLNLSDYIEPNLDFDIEKNREELEQNISLIPKSDGHVMAGEKIIGKGDVVDEYTDRVLSSLEEKLKKDSALEDNGYSILVGQIVFVAVLILLFTLYMSLFRGDYFEKPRSILMIYVLLTLFPVLTSLVVKHYGQQCVYLLPFAVVPIFIRVFMDSRTAFIAHTAMILICALAVKDRYTFVVIQLTAGLVAIYSLRELSQRAQLFRTALMVAVTSAVVYYTIQVMETNETKLVFTDTYWYIIANGVILLFAYPLMLVVEKMFGFISNVTLIELSNTSKDLLNRLSEMAPGTFQHSMMVSNLAAAIARKIGADAQLVRTGALYHDIGKMQNPAFFTENQGGVNPLEKMSRTEAAQIVISHVTEGLRMADKVGLPSVIRDFILTHHGEGMTKYFFISYKNEHPDQPVDDAIFRYPGPNPFTREQAILMMADATEAASRSLPEYTEESISSLVNRIIDGQVAEGFFKDCPITFRDIGVAKQVLTERLKNIYHTRICYPEPQKME